MRRSRRSRFTKGAPMLAAAALAAVVALLLFQLPAAALDVGGTPSPVTGNATYFSGLGSPYGGCGLPQANLDSQDFVALNVFNTPGDYGPHSRPVPPSMANILGMFDNGLNCDRYVKVTIGDFCTGTNDGAQNEPFCRNGSWVADQYNGATLTMVVADSCADSNAWCRDDPYHLDLHQDSLNRFVLNGSPVGSGLASHWNNRHISWQFVPTPNYTGDIQIGFLQGAQTWWGATAISHLPNGIHGVQYFANGVWNNATMDGDMGQAYILSPTTSGGTQFQIRVLDSADTLINNGRVYTFSLPARAAPSARRRTPRSPTRPATAVAAVVPRRPRRHRRAGARRASRSPAAGPVVSRPASPSPTPERHRSRPGPSALRSRGARRSPTPGTPRSPSPVRP